MTNEKAVWVAIEIGKHNRSNIKLTFNGKLISTLFELASYYSKVWEIAHEVCAEKAKDWDYLMDRFPIPDKIVVGVMNCGQESKIYYDGLWRNAEEPDVGEELAVDNFDGWRHLREGE